MRPDVPAPANLPMLYRFGVRDEVHAEAMEWGAESRRFTITPPDDHPPLARQA